MAYDANYKWTPDTSAGSYGAGGINSWGGGMQNFNAVPSNYGVMPQNTFNPNQNAGDFFSSGQSNNLFSNGSNINQAAAGDFFGAQGIAPTGTAGANLTNQDTGGFFDNFGGENGWGGTALQGLGGLASTWLGVQGLGVAKDQLAFQKDAFNRNFAQQRANQDQYRADRLETEKAAFA